MVNNKFRIWLVRFGRTVLLQIAYVGSPILYGLILIDLHPKCFQRSLHLRKVLSKLMHFITWFEPLSGVPLGLTGRNFNHTIRSIASRNSPRSP